MTKQKSLDKNKTKIMEKYYKELHDKMCLDVIFNGTMFNWGNMIDYINKFRDDKKNGKFR